MDRIKVICFFLRYLFTLTLFLLPAYTIYYWATSGYPFGYQSPVTVFPWPETASALPILDPHLPIKIRLAGLMVSMIPILIDMSILYLLTRLFRLYQSHQIFSITSVRYTRRIGWMMLLYQLVEPIYVFLMMAVFTYHYPSGHYHAFVPLFNIPKLTAIVIAMLIILISWIMEEGHKIYEENSYTV